MVPHPRVRLCLLPYSPLAVRSGLEGLLNCSAPNSLRPRIESRADRSTPKCCESPLTPRDSSMS